MVSDLADYLSYTRSGLKNSTVQFSPFFKCYRQFIVLWLFFSEPNIFKDFNKSVSPEELANDFKTLRTILKSNPQFGNFLVGPDVTRVLNHSKSARYLER